MNWTVSTGPAFPKDLASLPAKIQGRVANFVFVVLPTLENPFAVGKLEKLTGFQNFYRLRFGSYRLGLRLDDKTKTIHVLRVMHRRNIYRHFP